MVDNYIRGVALGEGTWGQVYEATRKSDNKRVAIKRIKPMDPHLGINFTALREIKYLREFKSDHVVDVSAVLYVVFTFSDGSFTFQMLEAFFSSGVLHLVLEFCPFDLEKVIRDKTILLKSGDIKCYMQMMLKGIECCHKNFVLHRGSLMIAVFCYVHSSSNSVQTLSLQIY